ncbi:porin (plasmid) [Dechloromonas sp. ARDL1]|uniref:porin n=1 Tax=Dechloromonas sp. ARDL1 TaxID=3322121 RepID=UPI003DA79709
MQKKLIALAVAGLASAGAFAQSNVTIYGVADGSFESVSANGASSGTGYASRTRIATNSSLIGFKGTEDLGNGLKAMFQVENQISLDGPSGTTTNSQSMGNGWNTRDTFVGLSGGFGAVLAGYISTPQRSTAAKYDLMPGATGSGSSLNMIGRVNLGGVAQGALGTTNNFGESTAVGGGQSVTNNVGTIFRSQALAYVTPVFNGFNGVIAYVPNENRDNTATGTGYKRNQYGWNAAANYANGPINVSLAYLKLNDIGAISAIGGAGAPFSGDQNHTNWLLGASYDLSPSTKVSFMYDNFKGKLGLSAGGEVEVKRNAFYLAGKQSFGANEIVLAYMKNGDNKVSGLAGNFGNSGAQAWSLRLAHNFSKRTQAYAIYTQIKNESNAVYDFNAIDSVAPAGTGGGVGTLNAGADPRVLGVGVRHNF